LSSIDVNRLQNRLLMLQAHRSQRRGSASFMHTDVGSERPDRWPGKSSRRALDPLRQHRAKVVLRALRESWARRPIWPTPIRISASSTHIIDGVLIVSPSKMRG